MSTDRRRNRVLTVLLALAVTGNFFWLMRLEAQAQATSRLLEHHADLDANIDTLEGLTEFRRRVGQHEIRVGNDGVSIESPWGSSESAVLRVREGSIELDVTPPGKPNNLFSIVTLAGRPFGFLTIGNSILKLSDRSIDLKTGDAKLSDRIHLTGDGISIESAGVSGVPGRLSLSEKSVLISAVPEGSSYDNFLSIYTLSGKPNAIIKVGGSSLKFDDGAIDLWADKDILIRSTGGDVRIEGQRVLLNE
jgi:hypothetical protein